MKKLRPILCALIVSAIYYFIALPPINIGDGMFWGGLILFFISLGVFSFLFEEVNDDWLSIVFLGCIICIVVPILGSISGTEFFKAKRYQQLITVQDGDFNTDISQIEIDQLPILDRASAEKLGDRRMGEMVDLVSQFEVASNYTQINIGDKPVRTTPLEYGGFFKWVNNKANGVPAYINVDMVTQNAELVRLDGAGMKYVPSAYLFKDLMRHLRFKYPTLIFGEYNFEVDDNGAPYYIVPVIEKTIGMFGGEDVSGVVICNPIDGSSIYYDIADVPTWVDRVYPADMIIAQLNFYGQYKDGWWNTVLAKKGVLNCTEGYNYLAIDDDIWLYTGFTSVGKDESNVGFMLVNLRTKEAKYYICPGAEEYSAMGSAEGAVANFGYKATFPLLINVNNEPTYLMSLKDSNSLVKMYALVNVTNYQVVAKGTTLKEAFSNYAKVMSGNTQTFDVSGVAVAQGKVLVIKDAVKDGNSYYYLQLEDNNNIYIASIEVSDMLPLTEVGDEVSLTYVEFMNDFKEVLTFERVNFIEMNEE